MGREMLFEQPPAPLGRGDECSIKELTIALLRPLVSTMSLVQSIILAYL